MIPRLRAWLRGWWRRHIVADHPTEPVAGLVVFDWFDAERADVLILFQQIAKDRQRPDRTTDGLRVQARGGRDLDPAVAAEVLCHHVARLTRDPREVVG